MRGLYFRRDNNVFFQSSIISKRFKEIKKKIVLVSNYLETHIMYMTN